MAAELELDRFRPFIPNEDTPGENWRELNTYASESSPAFVSPYLSRFRHSTRSHRTVKSTRQLRDIRTTRELLEQGLLELGRGLFVTMDDRPDYCRFCSHKTSDADRICSFCRAELETPAGLPYARDLLIQLARTVEQLPDE